VAGKLYRFCVLGREDADVRSAEYFATGKGSVDITCKTTHRQNPNVELEQGLYSNEETFCDRVELHILPDVHKVE
jgi:hypothetical protein